MAALIRELLVARVSGRLLAWTAPVVAAGLTLTAALVGAGTSPPHTATLRNTETLRSKTTTTVPSTTTTVPLPTGRIFQVPFAPILIGNASASRTCSVRDLRATAAGANGATGHSVTYIDLTDISSTPCRLEGYPRLVAEVPGHAPVAAGDGGGFFTSMAVDPAVVSPGSAFELSVGTERDCPLRYAQPDVYATLHADGISVGVPGGYLFVIEDLDVLCGITVSPYVQPAPQGPLPPAPPAFALQPEVASEPVEVGPGAPVAFKIIISDLSGKAVPLSPCPWFTETTDTISATTLSYLLNCAAAPPLLEPGNSLVLSMEMSAPTFPGQSTILWAWGAPYQEDGQTMQAAQEPGVDVMFTVR